MQTPPKPHIVKCSWYRGDGSPWRLYPSLKHKRSDPRSYIAVADSFQGIQAALKKYLRKIERNLKAAR